MATDVDVQYFSHLNGLVLGNNWGDLIRLLDKALVTGVNFTQITAASIDAQGDVHITLFAAHNSMLFQVVELSDFTPSALNQKYRIKGVPNAKQLILKPKEAITETSISIMGSGKLAPLGYDIVFRDMNDVKRVYRSKNPTSQHPFIRVDETISDGINSYNSSYAKYAMVGLLEDMTHIDDYENSNKLQLPLDTTNLRKNWKITGTGTGVVRGWSRWHWARNQTGYSSGSDVALPANGNRMFTLTGNADAFYMFNSFDLGTVKQLLGCGLYDSPYPNGMNKPNWFLMSPTDIRSASTNIDHTSITGGWPLMYSYLSSKFLINNFNLETSNHDFANPIMPARALGGSINPTYADDYRSGDNDTVSSGFFALQIPFTDSSRVRGVLRHISYAGGKVSKNQTSPIIEGSSMYVYDGSMVVSRGTGGCYFYLGEME